ncbi:hypothetical protein GCM10007304_18220 [Rhodococcoides trifolii]|uniref:Uncharacterized protein n=1 Tax=Rhodococcoides trifolii TaxID=908250 RepID=A0A917FTU4_9NOCA|nr:hypothetical protein [Rhodococcus trifolii]GGG04466.1 hypothetical protein GCM10007304_18220 [Rhodococcus trifolii]
MTEQELADRRDSMTLLERVVARRELDQAAGITYEVPPHPDVHHTARVMEPGVRRLVA